MSEVARRAKYPRDNERKVARMYPVVRVLPVLILLLAGSVSASEGVTATDSAISLNEGVADQAAAEAAVAGGVALAPPGELDTTFGTGGKSLIDLGGRGGIDGGFDVALQPDGKIIVAGAHLAAIGGNFNFAVARLLVPQGTLDPSYGLGDGWSNVDFGGQDQGRAVALQPDGKIVVAGQSILPNGTFDFAVTRLLEPQGTEDTSFGSGGRSLIDLGDRRGDDFGDAVALQPDGKIIVAGVHRATGGNSNFAVARLLVPQGTLDPSYGLGDGWSNVEFGGTDRGSAVALQPDGKIVVAGSRNANGTNDFAVTRLLEPQGTEDTSFGEGNGRSLTDFGGEDSGSAVALQPDGKIVVAGRSGGNFAVARLQPNGSPDTTFGPGGKSIVDFLGDDEGNAVALQRDGKILVAGWSDDNFAVARLQPNGLLDSTFGTGGKSIVDFGGIDRGYAVALQPDGRIVVAGTSNANGTSDFAVARLEGDPSGSGGGGPGGGGPPTCAGKPATIIGTEAADTLTGTPQKDVIVGLGGKDRIRAGGASDIVCAGSGNDTLAGQGGKDQLRGEKGKDRLLGGSGADRLIGGPGADRLVGGPGNDKLLGGPGNDSQQQ
jgi:uncharacterized delta-60 repeat protein